MDKAQILAKWERNNVPYYFYFGVLASILGLAGLLIFDLLLFEEHFTFYLPHRLTMVCVLSLAALVAHRNKVHLHPHGYRIIFPVALTVMILSSLWYQYFLLVCPESDYKIVLFGNIISVMAICLFTSPFRLLNLSFIIFSMLSYGLLSLRLGSDAHLLSVSTLFAAVVCAAQRRVFATMLYTDFKNKRVIFDAESAFALTVRRQDQRMDDIFPPRTSAVAILTADIRNSQCFFEAGGSDAQTKINSFFNLVNRAVEQMAPHSRKMVKTHGDEINVILYSHDLEDLPRLKEEIMAISQRMALDIFAQARAECAPDLLYDMGVSWGHNLVGLLGPDGLKAPDVYGHVIVEAKRFQELAKRLRVQEDFPIIVAKDPASIPSHRLVRSTIRPADSYKIRQEEVTVYKQIS